MLKLESACGELQTQVSVGEEEQKMLQETDARDVESLKAALQDARRSAEWHEAELAEHERAMRPGMGRAAAEAIAVVKVHHATCPRVAWLPILIELMRAEMSMHRCSHWRWTKQQQRKAVSLRSWLLQRHSWHWLRGGLQSSRHGLRWALISPSQN